MKNAMLVLISVSVFVFASSAFADNYITGKVGLYSPKDSLLDNGFNIEGAYGFDISDMTGIENLALELGLGYYTASGDESFFGMKTEMDLSVIPLTATAVYSAHLDGPISVFGGFGLGLYYAKAEVKISDPFFGAIKADDSEFKLGASIVGGGRYELNDQMDLTAELKYAAVSDSVGGLFVNFGVRYKF